jgi:hypothetical protein
MSENLTAARWELASTESMCEDVENRPHDIVTSDSPTLGLHDLSDATIMPVSVIKVKMY